MTPWEGEMHPFGLSNIAHLIGGDPGDGGGGTCPPPLEFFWGDRPPPSIFESLKNIYSYICILTQGK